MMSNGRFIAIFAAIFTLGALPLLLTQSLGTASAGITAGMMLPLNHIVHILVFFAVGILAAQLKAPSHSLLPAAFILMMALGVFIDLPDGTQEIPAEKFLVLGVILCFGLIANKMSITLFIASTALTSIIAFMLGSEYAEVIPHIAAPLYFLLGIMFSTVFVLLAGMCLGFTCSGTILHWSGRIYRFVLPKRVRRRKK